MLQYFIQTIAFQLFFLMVYDFLLKRETFFNWNRAYLLVTSVLSLLIPLIKIERFKNAISSEYIITLPEVIIGNVQQEGTQTVLQDPVLIFQKPWWSWEIIFLIGAGVTMLLFVFKLLKMFRILAKNPKKKVENLLIVNLLNSTAAFSFFKYIFLGELLSKNDKEVILQHEMVHVKQSHSLDLLFFEILRILFWFNPLIYMYQNRINVLHEFIADAQAVNPENKKAYYENLLSQVFETKKVSFINPFFKQSLIKKRIVMLTKSKSKQINLLKYTLLIPIVVGMLVYSACSVQNEEMNSRVNLDEFTFIIKFDESERDEVAIKQSRYENFLKGNKDYVGWMDVDDKYRTMTVSIHHKDEKVPDGFSRSEVEFPDGTGYITFLRSKGKQRPVIGNPSPSNDYLEEIDVPFAVIEQVPLFPGCEDLETKAEQRACMSQNISKFVNKNFNTNLAKGFGLIGRQRINVIFKIDTTGSVTGIRARAPHPGLEEEAKRVISLLPKMVPGTQKGKKVNVPYSLPIIFQVADVKKDAGVNNEKPN